MEAEVGGSKLESGEGDIDAQSGEEKGTSCSIGDAKDGGCCWREPVGVM